MRAPTIAINGTTFVVAHITHWRVVASGRSQQLQEVEIGTTGGVVTVGTVDTNGSRRISEELNKLFASE